MSEYINIANLPTTLGRAKVQQDLQESGSISGWHESVLRAYMIVKKVKWLLEKGTPGEVVLELIELMESGVPVANKEGQ